MTKIINVSEYWDIPLEGIRMPFKRFEGQIRYRYHRNFYSKFLTGSKVCGLALLFGFRRRNRADFGGYAYFMHKGHA